MTDSFKNTGKLIKFTLRRERIISVVWIILLVGITVLVPIALDNLFMAEGAESSVEEMATMMSNPAMVAMMGPAYGHDDYNAGKMTSNSMLLLTIIAVAIMNIFFVTRHTRNDEEQGRTEVVRSLPVGRLANLNATLISAAMLNMVIAVLSGFGLAALGIETMSFNGSLIYGFVLGASGLFFAALAAIFTQLSASAGGAVGYSFIAMAVLYLVRAVGDVNMGESLEILSFISPMGLILRTETYHNDYWWPILIVTLQAVAVAAIAFALNRVRDMGQGFIPAKPGKRNASAFLRSPLGLSLRLMKTLIIGWLIGMFTLGATYGSVMGGDTMKNFVEGNEYFQTMLGVTADTAAEIIVSQFIIFIMMITALIAVIPVTSIILRGKKEETQGRTESILSSAVSRPRYLAGYFGTAAVAGVLMLFAGAAGLYLACAAVMENPMSFGFMLESTMIYLPAVLVMLGFTTLVIGILPGKTIIAWIYFGFNFFVFYIGQLLNLPAWVGRLTPFGYISPTFEETGIGNILLLTGVFIVLSALGFMHYRIRDLITH